MVALVRGRRFWVGRGLQEVPVIMVRISTGVISGGCVSRCDRRGFGLVIVIIIVILFGVRSALDLFNLVDKIVKFA